MAAGDNLRKQVHVSQFFTRDATFSLATPNYEPLNDEFVRFLLCRSYVFEFLPRITCLGTMCIAQ